MRMHDHGICLTNAAAAEGGLPGGPLEHFPFNRARGKRNLVHKESDERLADFQDHHRIKMDVVRSGKGAIPHPVTKKHQMRVFSRYEKSNWDAAKLP